MNVCVYVCVHVREVMGEGYEEPSECQKCEKCDYISKILIVVIFGLESVISFWDGEK